MQNMAGREFNSDSFAVWADNINGPWSKPLYLTSIGFDPALFHDSDGRHYVSILEWETRTGYQAPGHIVIAEVNLDQGGIIGDWHRVTTGFTTRGCAEAPQIYKHDGYYYLLIAAGGTGYAHGVEIGRSKTILGPYEPNPTGEPIITSAPQHLFSLGDPDAGHFEMYNPNSLMQKAGHGSLVQTQTDEWYITHLMSRPLPETTLNPLGRETSLQKMVWRDGWLQMADGSNFAKMTTPGMTGSQITQLANADDIDDQFEQATYDLRFMTPYHEQAAHWVNTTEQPHHLRIYGNNSFFSQINPAIMATRATSLDYTVQTKVTFQADHYSESAGLGLYYDSNNWLYARLGLNDTEDGTILRILQAKLGDRTDDSHHQIVVPNQTAEIKLVYHFGVVQVWYRLATQNDWLKLGQSIDVSYLSDEGVNGEPGEIGGFTGLFNFIGPSTHINMIRLLILIITPFKTTKRSSYHGKKSSHP